MNFEKNPLTPHLQIYRLPLTAILSISHRLSGVILGFVYISFVFIFLEVIDDLKLKLELLKKKELDGLFVWINLEEEDVIRICIKFSIFKN